MATTGQAPVGFCPHCHYPIDPGVCPECGNVVAELAILTSTTRARSLKRRRMLRRAALMAALSLMVVIGVKTGYIQSRTPTRTLLAMQGDAKNWATCELYDRFVNGTLSHVEEEDFIRNALKIDLTVSPEPSRNDRSPNILVPNDLQFRVKLAVPLIRRSSATIGLELEFKNPRVDNLPSEILSPVAFWLANDGPAERKYLDSLGCLGKGFHTLEYEVKVVEPAVYRSYRTSPNVAVAFSRKIVKTFEITSAPIILDCPAEEKAQIKRSIQAFVKKVHLADGNRTQVLLIESKPVSMGVYGAILVREAGVGDYEKVCEIKWDGTNNLRLETDIGRLGLFPELDVRFRPWCPCELTLAARVNRFLGCSVEWNRIVSQRDETVSANRRG